MFASAFTLIIKWVQVRPRENICTVGPINYIVAAVLIAVVHRLWWSLCFRTAEFEGGNDGAGEVGFLQGCARQFAPKQKFQNRDVAVAAGSVCLDVCEEEVNYALAGEFATTRQEFEKEEELFLALVYGFARLLTGRLKDVLASQRHNSFQHLLCEDW